MILFLDPGAKNTGCALFEDRELTCAWLSRGEDWVSTADAVIRDIPVNACVIRTVVIERMQIYKGTPVAHANDCITLSLMAGRVTGALSGCEVISYTPKKWKGQVPKVIMVARIQSKLSPEERKRIDLPKAKDLWHNIYDAVGMGQYHFRKQRR